MSVWTGENTDFCKCFHLREPQEEHVRRSKGQGSGAKQKENTNQPTNDEHNASAVPREQHQHWRD